MYVGLVLRENPGFTVGLYRNWEYVTTSNLIVILQATVHIDGKEETITASSPESSEDSAASSEETVTQDETLPVGDHTFSLMDLAYTRSGDKGNNATIGRVSWQSHNTLSILST